ncbi:MAG: glucosamine-6-phosphate deaminase [Alistipes sp.]|nr:glucosamine-6-phosphate deaminase [Alistipes sp.]
MKAKYSLPQHGGLIANAVPKDLILRYEKLKTSIYADEDSAVQYVADAIVAAIHSYNIAASGTSAKPFLLGLSTGSTPSGLYEELARRYTLGEVSFENVAVCSLDEFYPMDPASVQSRNHRICRLLLDRVNIRKENIHLIDGSLPQEALAEYCATYVSRFGKPIDFLILGVGENGQIGFNEPGTYSKSTTRLVQLSHNTRKIQSEIFEDISSTPHTAITLGLATIMESKRIVLMAWGEHKASVIKSTVEGDITPAIPASLLQSHPDTEVIVDKGAAQQLTREQTPWLVGPCEWSPKLVRKAVVWLCSVVNRPILKLTYQDYVENSLGELLEQGRSYAKINIDVFNDLQHTITGWPGGKPNNNDTTRPVDSRIYPKSVLIFSPHPDDDVISMGGTLIRLAENGHNVHVAYQTSGNIAVDDQVVLQHLDLMRELGVGNAFDKKIITNKNRETGDPRELLDIKGAIRRSEARAALVVCGLNPDTNAHFLNSPFYETGSTKKSAPTERDIEIVVELLRKIKPHQIYAAGDLLDPHGTHRTCIEIILAAVDVVKDDEWFSDCHLWLYRGAWMEWDLGVVDMAVPLSPEEVIRKRHAIYRHLSQKDIVPYPGDDAREFWQRAEDRTQSTAKLYDKLGMAEYQAIEVFVKML